MQLMLKSKRQICATSFTNNTTPSVKSSLDVSLSLYFSLREHLYSNQRFIFPLHQAIDRFWDHHRFKMRLI